MRSIGIGAWGEDVTTLQEILNNLGYKVKIDGIFGNATRAAVLKFQELNADQSGAPLVVDGIVGPKTWWALTRAPMVNAGVPPVADRNKLVLIGIAAVLIGGFIFLSGKS